MPSSAAAGNATALPGDDALRERIEAAIEGLLDLLDALDGDVDAEPDEDDEPTLGFPESRAWSCCGHSQDDCEEDDCDAEPSLGSLEGYEPGNQEHWAHSSGSDGERDAGEEPEADPGEDGVADEGAFALHWDEVQAANSFWESMRDWRHRDEICQLRRDLKDLRARKFRAQRKAMRAARHPHGGGRKSGGVHVTAHEK